MRIKVKAHYEKKLIFETIITDNKKQEVKELQLPIEFLSQPMIGASSGAELRQRTNPHFRDNSQFAKIIEEAIARKSLLPIDNSKQNESEPVYVHPVSPVKPDEDPDETLAAGAIADQYLIVSILEGDMESDANPELHVDATQSADTSHAESATPPVDIATHETEHIIEQYVLKDSEATAINNEADETQSAPVNAKNDDAMQADAYKTGTDGDEQAAHQAGEATARMPAWATKQQEDKEINTKQSDAGNLSPLENENDAAPIKEQSKPQDSNMAQTDRRDTRDFEQVLNNASPPLSEGIKPERFRADQQMKQASFEAPVKAENLFEEMISRIDSMKTDTMKSMTIQLKPEFLGKVALEIAIDAAGLHVRIDAANSDVRAMINGQINALLESLEQKGIAVAEVEVTDTSVNNGLLNQSNGGNAQPGKSKNKYRGVNQAEGMEFYTAMPFDAMEYYLDTGVSSVEYRA